MAKVVVKIVQGIADLQYCYTNHVIAADYLPISSSVCVPKIMKIGWLGKNYEAYVLSRPLYSAKVSEENQSDVCVVCM